MQALSEAHDTSVRFAAESFGVGWIDQRAPFQRSTNVASAVPVA